MLSMFYAWYALCIACIMFCMHYAFHALVLLHKVLRSFEKGYKSSNTGIQEKFMRRVKEIRMIWKERLIEDRAKIQELLGQIKSQDPPNKELEKEAEETLDSLAKMMKLLTVV